MRRRCFGGRFVLFGIAWVGILGLVTLSLWNALIPKILGLPAITFWQALGVLVLTRVLFGGWGTRMDKFRYARGWKNLTPEERQRFRQAMERQRPDDPTPV